MKKAERAQCVNMILTEQQKGQETGGLQLDILHNRFPGSNFALGRLSAEECHSDLIIQQSACVVRAHTKHRPCQTDH